MNALLAFAIVALILWLLYRVAIVIIAAMAFVYLIERGWRQRHRHIDRTFPF